MYNRNVKKYKKIKSVNIRSEKIKILMTLKTTQPKMFNRRRKNGIKNERQEANILRHNKLELLFSIRIQNY